MRDVFQLTRSWYGTERFAVATVIGTFNSAPRPVGSTMAVSAHGKVIGSISGGCVEGAVYEVALEVIRTGKSCVERYGISDEDAFAVGLTCGGIIDVLVQPVDERAYREYGEIADSITVGEPVVLATCVSPGKNFGGRLATWGNRVSGGFVDPGLDETVLEDIGSLLVEDYAGVRHYKISNAEIVVQAFPPQAKMFIFGAIDFAAALAEVGKFLGFCVTVCDARSVFATVERFPQADEVLVCWPHRFLAQAEAARLIDKRTVICVLTHDPKFDIPLLELALRTEAGYIGAMGSRRTHADRIIRLKQLGFTETELARLCSPIGLDLGSTTPEETAISIAAEIVAVRTQASGRPLSKTTGRIHGRQRDRSPTITH